MDEDIERYQRVAAGFLARVAATPADRWSAPSPCEGWLARDVVDHVLGGHSMVLARATDGEAEPPDADADPAPAFRAVADAVVAAATDPRTAGRGVDGPMGPMTFGQMVVTLGVVELLVHTWDLARAVGGDERLDEDAVRFAFDLLRPAGDRLRSPQAFGPAVEPPPDADLQTRFLCFLGRPA